MGMDRPNFDEIKGFAEFSKYYWYRDELIKICKAHGLKAPSGKIELYKVIEAYFSGVGTVSEWVKDPDISSDGIHLDNIPSKNAAHYVSKIKNALDAYYELYATERK